MTRNAVDFLATAANPDGSFGQTYTRFQTGLAILAFLSEGDRPGAGKRGAALAKAAAWLVKSQDVTGFLGDRELPMETHAVAALALTEMIGMSADPVENRRFYRAALRALDYTLEGQDKAYGGRYNGGWKAESRAKINDRKVSAWQLALIRAAQTCGVPVPKSALLRGMAFMKASFKPRDEKFHKYDVGGFSYDAEGLPVRSISAAGLYCMEAFAEPMSDRKLAAEWFANNPPVWNGPHFYETEFFALRALKFHAWADGGDAARRRFADYLRVLTELLHEQQRPDGSFALPPENAEYTREMGPTYTSAMAVIILNCERNLLPMDRVPARAAIGSAEAPKDETP